MGLLGTQTFNGVGIRNFYTSVTYCQKCYEDCDQTGQSKYPLLDFYLICKILEVFAYEVISQWKCNEHRNHDQFQKVPG